MKKIIFTIMLLIVVLSVYSQKYTTSITLDFLSDDFTKNQPTDCKVVILENMTTYILTASQVIGTDMNDVIAADECFIDNEGVFMKIENAIDADSLINAKLDSAYTAWGVGSGGISGTDSVKVIADSLFMYKPDTILVFGADRIGIPSTPSVVPIIYDNFETGSASASWTVVVGTVDTYTNFGIAAPTDGGSYGMQHNSGERLVKNFSVDYGEIWMWTDIRTGSAALSTYVGGYNELPATQVVHVRFTADALPNFQILVLDPYYDYKSTETFLPSTWYKVLVRCVFDGTNTIIQGWVDSGGGYVLVIDETGLNTHVLNSGSIGSTNSGQTGYVDNAGFYPSDPRN